MPQVEKYGAPRLGSGGDFECGVHGALTPVLEAMSSGVPVVCSNSSSLPEVAGDAALMCEAKDTETLTQLIRLGLEDETWRSSAVEQGLLHAARFSWKRCAMETLQVYQRVAKGQ